jgi:hypothetical protein
MFTRARKAENSRGILALVQLETAFLNLQSEGNYRERSSRTVDAKGKRSGHGKSAVKTSRD